MYFGIFKILPKISTTKARRVKFAICGDFCKFSSNLAVSRCGSGHVKFEAKFINLAEFSLKFERKTIRRSIFCSRRGAFKFGDGSYHVGNDRAEFKSNEV